MYDFLILRFRVEGLLARDLRASGLTREWRDSFLNNERPETCNLTNSRPHALLDLNTLTKHYTQPANPRTLNSNPSLTPWTTTELHTVLRATNARQSSTTPHRSRESLNNESRRP